MYCVCLVWIMSSTILIVHATDTVSFDDPWEQFNRSIFDFNTTLDDYVLRPVTVGYQDYTPKPIRGMVSHFFQNIGEVRNFINAVLQLKFENAGLSLLRFALNSTIGQLGLVDVATPIGITARNTDFGLTLARWHISSGPYLVLPFMGPSTVRSSLGLIPDSYTYAPNYIDAKYEAGLVTLDIIQRREKLLSTETLITGDRYIFIRDAYLQRRLFQVTGKLPEDNF